ncbi:Nose resistant to fluoxetine protein 6, partial [Stegodyphus mimosarum]
MFLGTSFDIYCSKKKVALQNTSSRALLAFSLPANFKKLMNTKTSSSNLSCLHGIRFFSSTWVLLGHNYFIINFYLLDNLNKVLDYSRDFAFQ